MSSPYVMYTFWNETFHLVFDEFKTLIVNKEKTLNNVEHWLNSPNRDIEDNQYGKNLNYLGRLNKEINLLKSIENLLPSIKLSYDRYLVQMTSYRDSEISLLKDENHVLRLKLRRYGTKN